MKVLKYTVNKVPELIEIENGLEAMQSEVDGYIETVTFPSVNAVLVCNEEGKVKNYPMNAGITVSYTHLRLPTILLV